MWVLDVGQTFFSIHESAWKLTEVIFTDTFVKWPSLPLNLPYMMYINQIFQYRTETHDLGSRCIGNIYMEGSVLGTHINLILLVTASSHPKKKTTFPDIGWNFLLSKLLYLLMAISNS